MENLNIVIVGHVDHGKSTLIGRLFYDTDCFPKEKIEEIKKTCEMQGRDFEFAFILDALEEERQQGITIDTTQTFFTTDKRQYTIIDAPGHVEFVKNMLTGASQAESAILVVDATEGVKEQTIRHSHMISLIGITQIIVVINKMDKVEYSKEIFTQLKNDITELFHKLNIYPKIVIPISARQGDNIAKASEKMDFYKKNYLLEALDSLDKISISGDGVLCYPIQDVYKIDDKRILAGRVESGTISAGQKVTFLPSKKETVIKSIEIFEKSKETASKGESIGITLESPLFIERGDVLTNNAETLTISKKINAKVIWLSKFKYKVGGKLTISCSTQEIDCAITEVIKLIDSSDFTEIKDKNYINEFDIAISNIELKSEIVFADFFKIPELSRFVLTKDNEVIAGGDYK